jgi:hypothetical protein
MDEKEIEKRLREIIPLDNPSYLGIYCIFMNFLFHPRLSKFFYGCSMEERIDKEVKNNVSDIKYQEYLNLKEQVNKEVL